MGSLQPEPLADPELLLLQVATGKGVIGQIAQELSIPPGLAELGLYGTIAYGLIGALRPGSPTFSKSNQEDVKKRGKGELIMQSIVQQFAPLQPATLYTAERSPTDMHAKSLFSECTECKLCYRRRGICLILMH